MAIVIGVDVGQQVDPTVLVAVSSYRTEPDLVLAPLPRFRPAPTSELVHQIGGIERVPLGTPYPIVVERLVELAQMAAEVDAVTLVVDQTGVGRPVIDMLRRATSLPIRAVTITGADETSEPKPGQFRVPKRDLVGRLAVVMETRRLEALPGLALASDLRDELQHFQLEISRSGTDTYEAASGSHDDFVIALALAVWYGENPGDGAIFLEAWRRMAARDGLVVRRSSYRRGVVA